MEMKIHIQISSLTKLTCKLELRHSKYSEYSWKQQGNGGKNPGMDEGRTERGTENVEFSLCKKIKVFVVLSMGF